MAALVAGLSQSALALGIPDHAPDQFGELVLGFEHVALHGHSLTWLEARTPSLLPTAQPSEVSSFSADSTASSASLSSSSAVRFWIGCGT